MQNPDDHTLIERLKQDDKVAFRALFDRHYKVLLGTSVNLLREEAAGKDVVQEVFFQIWKKRKELTIHSSVAAYLKRSVINRSINYLKAQQRFTEEEAAGEQEASETSTLEGLALEELESALQAALDTLPERCRLVFVMKRLEGLSVKEIAATLEISPKTVENQLTKAIKVLKDALHYYRKEKGGGT